MEWETEYGDRRTFQARGNNAKRRATAGLIKHIVSAAQQRRRYMPARRYARVHCAPVDSAQRDYGQRARIERVCKRRTARR